MRDVAVGQAEAAAKSFVSFGEDTDSIPPGLDVKQLGRTVVMIDSDAEPEALVAIEECVGES